MPLVPCFVWECLTNWQKKGSTGVFDNKYTNQLARYDYETTTGQKDNVQFVNMSCV